MHLLVLVGSLGSICTLNLKSLQLHPLQTADRTLCQEMSSVAESDTADGGRHRRRRRVDRHERRCRCRCSASASKPRRDTRHRSHNSLVFGCMNVRSAAGKIDDIIAMKRYQSIDVLCLCETWHDEDSASIRRLRGSARTRPSQVSQRVVDFVHKPRRRSDCRASRHTADHHYHHRAGDATFNSGRPRLRRRSTARLEQSAGRDPSQPISGCLQTFTENSLLYPESVSYTHLTLPTKRIV